MLSKSKKTTLPKRFKISLSQPRAEERVGGGWRDGRSRQTKRSKNEGDGWLLVWNGRSPLSLCNGGEVGGFFKTEGQKRKLSGNVDRTIMEEGKIKGILLYSVNERLALK